MASPVGTASLTRCTWPQARYSNRLNLRFFHKRGINNLKAMPGPFHQQITWACSVHESCRRSTAAPSAELPSATQWSSCQEAMQLPPMPHHAPPGPMPPGSGHKTNPLASRWDQACGVIHAPEPPWDQAEPGLQLSPFPCAFLTPIPPIGTSGSADREPRTLSLEAVFWDSVRQCSRHPQRQEGTLMLPEHLPSSRLYQVLHPYYFTLPQCDFPQKQNVIDRKLCPSKIHVLKP